MIKNLLTVGLVLTSLATLNAQQNVMVSGKLSIDPNSKFVAAENVQPSQNVAGKSQVAPIGDSLAYFYNKHTLRNTTANANSFYTSIMPQPPTYSLTGMGSSFLNPGGAAVTVSGAYILASRQANSTSTAVPCRVYIWSAGPTGVPGAKLDSAMTSAPITNTLGNFYVATFTTPVVVNGAFFISYKSVPTLPADTIRCFLTSGFTPTSTSGTGWAPPLKFGEGLSYLRGSGSWGATTNAFGPGTELEAIVVPKVSFSYTANGTQMAANGCSVNPAGYSANSFITFTSTSGPDVIDNRQFNFNAFAIAWLPFVNTSSLVPVPDPIYNWSFGGCAPSVPGTYTTANCQHFWGSAGTNANASLIVKYQHGSAGYFTSGGKYTDLKTFPTFTIVNCGLPPIVGINSNSYVSNNLSVYPNPVVNGKATVSGLEGMNTVSVYNMLGQMVSTVTSDKENVSIDLTNQVQGTYLVRITDSYSKSKTVKVINQ